MVEGIYVNLSCQMKEYIIAVDAKKSERDARFSLLVAYDVLPEHTDYAHVVRAEFKEKAGGSRGQRKKRKVKDRSMLERFGSIGTPPAPSACQQLLSRAAQPALAALL